MNVLYDTLGLMQRATSQHTFIRTKNRFTLYSSVGYIYKGFNYALSPRLFDESYFELDEVQQIKAIFAKDNISEYPKLETIKKTRWR